MCVCFSFRLLLFRLGLLLLAPLLSDAVRPGSCSVCVPCVVPSDSGTSNATPSRNGDPRGASAFGASTTAEPLLEDRHPIPRLRHPQRHYKGEDNVAEHKLMENPTISIDHPLRGH
ncbi:hypothetical protein B0H17DRAFT_1034178 [Mycena rosella]|uniref:Secreted protein n=1 Tax=Mycena rosella TaxID=1033263 RepID=A0AAD7GW68_MYCRO|nr:hypothetical protein B0H17DRAFT_1034178 [Mycena rosella]